MPITVSLDLWEFKCCVDLAAIRMATSNAAGWNHSSTYERDYLKRIEEEIVGACGEMAVGRALDCFWSPSVNTFHHKSDLPRRMEVRSTRDRENRLIIRDNDPDDRFYFLVVGDPPVMTVVGWIMGAEGKQDRFLDNPNGYRESWFVPQRFLHPFNEKSEVSQALEGVSS